MFFFKKPEIVVDVFTADAGLIQTMPITQSSKYMPEWWKTLPPQIVKQPDYFPSGTMKKCRGFLDYYANSITIPLWSDLAIRTTENNQYAWQFSDRVSEATIHDAFQRGSYLPSDKYGHIKLASPWSIKTKEKINWVWSQPTWNFDIPDALVIPPAVLNFYDQHSCNVNMFFRTDALQDLFLPFGQPLAHLTPMTEKKIVLRRHLVTKEEIQRINAVQNLFTFTNKYNAVVKNQERFAGCPFHKDI